MAGRVRYASMESLGPDDECPIAPEHADADTVFDPASLTASVPASVLKMNPLN